MKARRAMKHWMPIAAEAEASVADLESLIRADYAHCHPDETFADLKHRAPFATDAAGLLSEWMAVARQRAAAAGGLSIPAAPVGRRR
jgi:hypothetical protein